MEEGGPSFPFCLDSKVQQTLIVTFRHNQPHKENNKRKKPTGKMKRRIEHVMPDPTKKSSRGLRGHDLPISMEVNAGGMKMVEGEGDSRQEIKTTQKK